MKNSVIIGLVLILSSINCYKKITQNNFIFFDPVTTNPCNETNYWTPFYTKTTCYRFVSIQTKDTDTAKQIKIMLDHNIGKSNFSNFRTVLKDKTSKWTRVNGTADIIDEKTIFGLMKYSGSYPTGTTKKSPPHKMYHYCMNSIYIVDGSKTNQKGYWTKTTKDNKAYAITDSGQNYLESKSTSLGLRPVITVDKDLVKLNTPVINIDSLVDKTTTYHYKHETKTYDGLVYKQLQGFTVTKDKLVYHVSNNNNREKGVLYSIMLKNMKTIYSKNYDKTGHGNGMTFNSKSNKALVIGPYEYKQIWEMNGDTLKHEKSYKTSDGYPKVSAMGYDDINNFYIGLSSRQVFNSDTSTFKKGQGFDIAFWETSQDIEAHNGYLFVVTSELGTETGYQSYSFHTRGQNIIYVYNIKLDKDKKPTKDFGRFVCSLIVDKKGELEDVAFNDGYIYFGFASHKVSTDHSISFYKLEYKKLVDFVKKKAQENGGQYFE